MFGKSAFLMAILCTLCFSQAWSASLKRTTIAANEATGPCTCAIFEAKSVDKSGPLISKSYVNVTCDNTGKNSCMNLCTTLAKASKERATTALCQTIGNKQHIIASLFVQTCSDPWEYSGITGAEPICCYQNRSVACPPPTMPRVVVA